MYYEKQRSFPKKFYDTSLGVVLDVVVPAMVNYDSSKVKLGLENIKILGQGLG